LLLLFLLVASTQIAQAQTGARTQFQRHNLMRALDDPTLTPAVPTVAVPTGQPVSVPTVTIPKPGHPHPKKKPNKAPKKAAGKTPTSTPARNQNGTWIWAYLTSYCPGSAGWISSSGMPVFYGMLANNYYPFGTHVYIPVLGITGVVEDHVGDYSWNHFDVWSPVCYGTPTGWFKVAIEG
jgi:3D (Asp-Asp-Asp) domain-containing protein